MNRSISIVRGVWQLVHLLKAAFGKFTVDPDSALITKATRFAPSKKLAGDHLEFGVCTGESFVSAFYAIRRVFAGASTPARASDLLLPDKPVENRARDCSVGEVEQPIRLAVVYASDYDKTSPGGIATGILRIVTGLRASFRVLLVCVAEVNDIEAIRGRFSFRDLAVVPVLSPSRRLRFIPLNITYALALFLKRQEILRDADVVHAHRMESALPFVVRKTKPVVLTVHGSSKDHALCRTGLLRWRVVRRVYDLVEGFVFSRVDRITLVSKEALHYYSRRYPHLREKFVLIPPVLDTAAFQPVARDVARSHHGLRDGDLAVVFAGRLSEQKRVDLVIDAFAILARERSSAHLLIAGVGPEEASLRRQAAELGLQNIRFLGLLSTHEVRVLLSCADTVVLPSLWEGLPMVVLEALACGVPVVASNVGGINEVLAECLQDFVLASDEPGELKSKILEAAKRREALRDVCVARARCFDAGTVLVRLEGVYGELANGSRGESTEQHRGLRY